MHTPFFPSWGAWLAPRNPRLPQLFHQVCGYTLCRLELVLGAWIPPDLFPKARAKANSRDRDYTRRRTFWCMLWHCFHPDAAGREVVRQLMALFRLEGGPPLSPEDGAYFRARGRLDPAEFPKALSATAAAADQPLTKLGALRGRPVKIVDGSAVTLAETPANRKAYPPLQCATQPSFPMLRLVVLFSLLSGSILALAQGSLGVSELALLATLVGHLRPEDIVLGDRGFGCYPVIAWLKYSLNVDFIGRTTRRVDGRKRLRRLGRNDWLIDWKRGPKASPWLSALQWAGLPLHMTVRILRGSCYRKGFRVRQVTLVTTLLDGQLYPAAEILQAYLRRWRLEMCLDDLKTTLKMETLRNRSPKAVEQELYMRLIAHNLVRCLMAQAATEHGVPLDRISFKGSLDTLRQFSQAMAQARTKKAARPTARRPAGHPGRGPPAPAPRSARAARRQTQEKQVPTAQQAPASVPRSSQAQHAP
jgi:putative transposase